MSKFKVGDKVYIEKPDDVSQSPGWTNMTAGEFTVSKVHDRYDGSFHCSEDFEEYIYRDSWATLVTPAIKAGDMVRVENNGLGCLTWLSGCHREGLFEVGSVVGDTGSIHFEGSGLYYDKKWCTLVTETEEETQEQFDIEKVDISWFTNRVKVGDVVIKGDSIGFLREEYRLHRALPLIAVDSKGFQTGCYWVYAVLPADRDLLLEYLQLKEDTFKNNQSKAGIYSRESSLGYKLLQADADMTDEIATSQEDAKWNNNIPEKGVLCWVSDDFVADSSC